MNEEVIQLVKDLAGVDPSSGGRCFFCGCMLYMKQDHTADCLWAKAKKYRDKTPGQKLREDPSKKTIDIPNTENRRLKICSGADKCDLNVCGHIGPHKKTVICDHRCPNDEDVRCVPVPVKEFAMKQPAKVGA